MQVWSADAAGNPSESDRSTEPGIAADRFAREILRILTLSVVRSRQLNAKPFGGARCTHTAAVSVAMRVSSSASTNQQIHALMVW